MRRAAAALLAAALLVTPLATAGLPTRAATFTWDKAGTLKGTFSYQDAIDDKLIRTRLAQGLPVNLVMRGYVYRVGGSTPIALTGHTCRVAYDLWQEVFFVVVNNGNKQVAANLKGVFRKCTDMVDLPISDRTSLKGPGNNFFLAVKIEVNPVSPKLLQEMQAWVTRPLGVSGTIGTGDALFATFVSVFMQKSVANAAKVIEFQTNPFPP